MTQTLLEIVQHHFGLEIIETTVPLVTPQPLHEPLLAQWMIEAGRDRIGPKTNETTRREGIVGQIMLSLPAALEYSLWMGYPFEVDPMKGLVGECDYLVSRSPLTFRIHPPVVLIVEVKRTLDRCLPHCLVEMAAAQLFNASTDPIYGVLTTGLEWQFLKLEGAIVTLEQTIYKLDSLDRVASILTSMVA
ncbi:MAG TPA: hypothetical protein V6C84_24635 [Coleofasciculaceae cyanobacterium]|jgi:hypothetical protein